ncbi:hypothetical protein [Accumulibacter sp.]|uniref:hypothetical protein n=1 Tax=Accumulibacter sp. TaxID=2053492 RepID=UPI0025E08B27|nr:hypothetical protein [Accumulibacter sp.]MCM8596323.1 hypothetical protein [Accumulibacter sp.]MCM8627457.1 hypothetical protein [Accumulibacter sp.]MDS4050472.1 hypothetical protein [Accumulibacter sp.]
MGKLSSKLRIGEKIGLGFALVGLLFAGVIWHFHETLHSLLGDYQQLQTVHEARKSLALEIEIEMAAARDAEKNFLLLRRERFAEEVTRHLEVLREKVGAFAAIDEPSRRTAEELSALLAAYERSFAALADAWRSMGLDENSGIQGAFRQKIHRLHELSAQYNIDQLYTVLLQIRRNEKDLALRLDPAYRDRVRRLTAEFRQLVESSELPEATRQRLRSDLAAYARSFDEYADRVLRTGQADGGKGPFREAAQRIEALLDTYHVANLETGVLQLRRREKDFLLRGDESYPPMVVELARELRARISESAIPAADKAVLLGLLRDYQRSFLVLVSQHARIRELSEEMDSAAARVAPLIQRNVDEANRTMASRVATIGESSRAAVRVDLIVLFCAIAAGLTVATLITIGIVRPVRQMAGLLDDLAYGSPAGRVDTVADGRDEINAMGQSLNALIDHRANFLGWWKASMGELAAARDLHAAEDDATRDQATRELRWAVSAMLQQLRSIRSHAVDHARRIADLAQRFSSTGSRIGADEARTIEHSLQAMVALLEAVGDDDTAQDRRRAS